MEGGMGREVMRGVEEWNGGIGGGVDGVMPSEKLPSSN